MGIIFDSVPSSAKANLTAVELTKDKLSTGLNVVTQRIALVGQADASLTSYTAGVPSQVFSANEVGQKYGFGSQIHLMAIKLFANCGSVEVEAFPLKEDVADVAATGSIAITASTVLAGTLALYIAGEYVSVPVTAGQTATQIGDAIVTAVTANANLPVSAVNTSGTVAFTANWKGLTGNDIDISVNLGSDDSLPSGVSVVITDMASGRGNPTISTSLANISENDIYTVIVHPYTDTTNLTAIEAFEATRWDSRVVKGFVAITAIRGSYATAIALTESRNSFVSSIVGAQGIPQTGAEVASAVAGVVAKSAASDPSLQFHPTQIIGLTAPAKSDRWAWTVQDAALKKGCSTLSVVNGNVVIGQMINTYQTTSTGAKAPDVDTYLNTVMTLIAILYDRQQYFLQTWGRAKLSVDGQTFATGQRVMTPVVMKAELLARYDLYIERGWVLDRESYKDTIIVEIDSSNKNRLNSYDQLILMGNLRVLAMKVGYNFSA